MRSDVQFILRISRSGVRVTPGALSFRLFAGGSCWLCPFFIMEFGALYVKNKKKSQKKLDDCVTAAFEKIAGLTAKLLAGGKGS